MQLRELNERKRSWVFIFFIILAFLVLWFGMAYLRLYSGKLQFCDSDDYTEQKGCRPCPELAICRGGKITGCSRPSHKLSGEFCIRDDASLQVVYHEMVNHLSSLRGQAECGDQNLSFKKSKTEIQGYLETKFKDNHNLLYAVGEAVSELPSIYDTSTSPIGVEEPQTGPVLYFANAASHSLLCSARIAVKTHRYVFAAGLLLLALVFVKIDGIKKEIERRKQGEQYYLYIEGLLQQAHNHQMFEEEIKKHLRVHFSRSKSEIDDVFNYVMNAAYKSEKIDYTKKSENGIEQRVWWMDV